MSERATLLIRIRKPDGKRSFNQPVYAANKRLKPLYAVVDGKPELHPEGVYYIRYSAYGKRMWLNAGSDPALSQTHLARHVHALEGLAIDIQSPVLPVPKPVEVKPNRLRWDLCYREYILEIESRRRRKTAYSYRKTLDDFAKFCPVTYMDEINRLAVLNFERALRLDKRADRTVFGHVSQLVTFLQR